MPLDLLITLVAGFLFVALVAGYGTSAFFSAMSPERRRLRQMAAGGPAGVVDAQRHARRHRRSQAEANSGHAKVAEGNGTACVAASPGLDTRA